MNIKVTFFQTVSVIRNDKLTKIMIIHYQNILQNIQPLEKLGLTYRSGNNDYRNYHSFNYLSTIII